MLSFSGILWRWVKKKIQILIF
jgi:hypothetical protein